MMWPAGIMRRSRFRPWQLSRSVRGSGSGALGGALAGAPCGLTECGPLGRCEHSAALLAGAGGGAALGLAGRFSREPRRMVPRSKTPANGTPAKGSHNKIERRLQMKYPKPSKSLDIINSDRIWEFARACYNTNSMQELLDAREGDVDPVDLRAWGITVGEWRQAVNIALQWMEDQRARKFFGQEWQEDAGEE